MKLMRALGSRARGSGACRRVGASPLQLMQRRVIALQHIKNARISRREARNEADARNGLARERQRRVQTRWRIAPLQLMQRRVIALQHSQSARISRRAARDEVDARNGLARERQLLQDLRLSALPQQLHRPRC